MHDNFIEIIINLLIRPDVTCTSGIKLGELSHTHSANCGEGSPQISEHHLRKLRNKKLRKLRNKNLRKLRNTHQHNMQLGRRRSFSLTRANADKLYSYTDKLKYQWRIQILRRGRARNNNCARSARKLFTTPTFPSWPRPQNACDRAPIEQKRWFSTFLVSFVDNFMKIPGLRGYRREGGLGEGLGSFLY